MLVLVNAALTPDTVRALERERSWELRTVEHISTAVSQMPEHERLSVRAVIVEAEPVDGLLMAQLERLELIACLRSDPVNVDVAAATARGIPVVHTPGRNAEAVADFALGLCLSSVRNIAVTHHLIVEGDLTGLPASGGAGSVPGDKIWRPADPDVPIPYVVYRGRLLSSLIVGVIGYGAVGRAVARRFAGLARAVQVTDPAVSPEAIKADGFISVSLSELLSAADVVTVHARSKQVIIGRDELQQMKPGSILINTARATVLDYGALVESLESGQLSAAALDVYPEEPLPASSPLRHQRGLTLTPHLAGAAAEVADRQSEIFLEAVRGLYGGSAWEDLPVRNQELRHLWTAHRGVVGSPRSGDDAVTQLDGA
jgi:D-3-phosphoglycerate dehydrogenase / 2-oxoglutarate reductase